MKKHSFTFIFLILIAIVGYSQEKGSYLTISGGLGYGGFNYSLKGVRMDGKNLYRLGGQAQIGYSYFFTRHWGISTGVGISYYESIGKFDQPLSKDNYYSLGKYTDNDPVNADLRNYELRVRLGNWEEKQTGYFLEIPLLLSYQHKFGKKQRHGLYFGIGGKVQIPVNTSYKVLDGKYEDDLRLNISGQYERQNGSTVGVPDMGAPGEEAVPQHGYGSIHNPNAKYGWGGDTQLKISFAATGELGALFGLSRRCDLMLGGYVDYGFNNLKKGEDKEFIEGPQNYHPGQSGETINVGEGIVYNGMLNSNATEKVNLVSVGAKVGLKIKLGKLSQEEQEEIEDIPVIPERQDSIIRDTIIIEHHHHYYKEEKNPGTIIINPIVETDEDGLTQEDIAILKERIFFDLNSSVLRTASRLTLDRKVAFMNRHPEMKIRILGNTCDLGNERINIPLGLKRAEEARRYMVMKGIHPNRIITATQSTHDPLLPNTSEANRALNRRCDFEVDRR